VSVFFLLPDFAVVFVVNFFIHRVVHCLCFFCIDFLAADSSKGHGMPQKSAMWDTSNFNG